MPGWESEVDAGPRAVVADEVALVRRGVAAVLEGIGVETLAETHAGRDAARLAAAEGVELVVIGAVADMALAEALRRVGRLRPAPLAVALVARRTDPVAGLLDAAAGLLLRSARPDELAEAVQRVLKGERVVDPALASSLVGEVVPRDDGSGAPVLTLREREILGFLAEGRSNREIAAEMYVTLATVKSHVAHVYAKLGASNRNEVLGRAVELGLLG